METPDFDAIRRETVRWLILLCANAGDWLGVGEHQVRATLATEYPNLPLSVLRHEVRYLANRGYLKLEVHDGQPWRATITLSLIHI